MKYEYKTLNPSIDDNVQKLINEYADMGWIVDEITSTDTYNKGLFVVMKREK